MEDHVDILITGIHEMAGFYGISGRHPSPEAILQEDLDDLDDEDISAFAQEVIHRFDLRLVAITMRHPDSLEQQRWEAAIADDKGNLIRSSAPKKVVIRDRLGGGDAWNAGFYYGLLTEGQAVKGLHKGLLVGDAATRLQQTLLFDLPIITKDEVQTLIEADSVDHAIQTTR